MIGVTIACFIDDGKVADSSEELTSFTKIFVIIGPEAFTSHVGTVSRAHCLFGHRLRSSWISLQVTLLYDDRLVLYVRSNDGGAAPDVDARMVSTLPLKCATNCAGVMDVDCVDIKPDSVFHRALVSPALSDTRPF